MSTEFRFSGYSPVTRPKAGLLSFLARCIGPFGRLRRWKRGIILYCVQSHRQEMPHELRILQRLGAVYCFNYSGLDQRSQMLLREHVASATVHRCLSEEHGTIWT